MQTIRVLLCEDNNSFRESLQSFIDDTEGFEVVGSVSSAQNILPVIQAANPDIILMDVDLPGTSGIEATSTIKASFPKVNVLILTVYDDEQKIFDAILAGATGYLLKKTDPVKILDSIRELQEGGASMSASIVKKVLSFFKQTEKAPTENAYTLSDRELDILQCLVNGDSYKMISDNCHITIGTVRSHINNIYKKLHINSKSEAVAKALREGLLS